MLEEPWLKHITNNLKVFLFTWSVISFWHTTFTHHKLLSRLFSKDTGSELWDRQWILHCVLVYSGLTWLNVCGLMIRSQSNAHMLALHAFGLCLFYEKSKNIFGFYLFLYKNLFFLYYEVPRNLSKVWKCVSNYWDWVIQDTWKQITQPCTSFPGTQAKTIKSDTGVRKPWSCQNLSHTGRPEGITTL